MTCQFQDWPINTKYGTPINEMFSVYIQVDDGSDSNDGANQSTDEAVEDDAENKNTTTDPKQFDTSDSDTEAYHSTSSNHVALC